MKLSKTDFADNQACAKTFWLRRRDPNTIAWKPLTAAEQMRMREGQEVEAESEPYVRHHFAGHGIHRQMVFETETLLARADYVVVVDQEARLIDIVEVKGSTSVKKAGGKEHIADGAFQLLAAERAGWTVRSVHIVHLDPDYSFAGELDRLNLFSHADITMEARELLNTLEAEIDAAAALLASDELDRDGCDCRFYGSARHCEGFRYFNPAVPAVSAHLLPRITEKKLREFDPEFALDGIDPARLSEPQRLVQKAFADGPQIDPAGIRQFLDGLAYPLHFYDYEASGPAIPPADGYRPYQQLPVQFSLHRLTQDGVLEHFEWIADGYGQQWELIDALKQYVLPEGSAVSWNMSYEKACNTRMAALHGDHAEFLLGLNDRTVDLEIPFRLSWVDGRFGGSTSIKKVLPVLCPDLRYNEAEVHDGTGAVEAWTQMISLPDGERRAELKRQLLAYCRLDTLAMVEIFRILKDTVAEH